MFSPIRVRCIRVATISLILLFGTAVTQAQQTIHVPTDQPTIQAAINAANNGDTVLVAPGTYVENSNFGGKAITVTSSGGPSVTTIDGGAQGSVVTFSTGEGLTSVLNGFTLRNGMRNGLSGGGIYIASASPTITGNIITGNYAAAGCGIYVGGGSPLIQNNVITANNGGDGCGILVEGVNSVAADPQIIGNTITNNASGGEGGGIAVYYFSSPLIQDNLIQGNVAYNPGGGVALQSYNSPILVQNLIVNNTSKGGSGGGLYVSPSDNPVQIIGNTIAANNANYDSTSALYVTGFGQNATFTDNIFVAAAGQNAVTCNSGFSSVSPVFSYNDAFSASGSAWSGICDATTNPGNLSSDPLFMSPANNDFHLQTASPAVNAGNNAAPNLPTTDFDGNPRIVGTIDLGAYEVVNTSAANISPNSLSFGGQTIGTSSAPQSANLASTGSTGFQITSFQLTSGFSATTNCPALGQPGGFAGVTSGNACTFSVSFTPSAAPLPTGQTPSGPMTGTLTVNGTNGASLVVSLSGTALSPSVTLSPSNLQFPLQQAGTTSAPQPVTLTNSGAGGLSIAGITPSQQFSETDNCGSFLAAGASCTINVSFTPTTSGNINGTLTISDDASGSPQTVILDGQGGSPNAWASPGALNFGNQALASTSASQNVTLSNTGNFTLTLNSITASGDFAQNNNCGSSLAPNGSCVISVVFTPTATGARSGVLTIADNNFYGSPQSVTLSGTGVTPAAVSLSPLSLAFPSQLVGTTSSAQTVTLANSGGASLNISAIATSQPFAQTNNCPASLAGGASCAISVTFTPQSSGSASGSVSITDNASGSPQSIPLTGTTPATVSLSASSLTFPGQVIGTTSTAQSVTLTNAGGANLNISGIATSQPFAQTNNCPASLAGGASCTISITFTPQSSGSASGSVSITDNASGSPQSVSLSGIGLTPAAVSLSASSLTFPGQVIGTTSAAQAVILTNTGGANLNISGIATSQPFAQTNNCPASLAGGAGCTISVTFTPQSSGSASGAVSITDDASGSPQSVSLGGTGLTPPAVSFSPLSLSFFTPLGTSSPSQTITVTNTGGATLNITNIAANQPFAITTSTCVNLAGGASCSVNISFTPQTNSSVTGAFTITDNASGSPQSVPLTGITPAAASFSPSSLTFSSQAIGTTSAAQTVTLTNTGGASLSINSIATSQPFAQTNNCPASLAGGASCTISATFTPQVSGTANGAVTISDNAAGSPQSLVLTGTTPAVASLSPSSLTFPATLIGSSAAQTVTLTNTGGASMNISVLSYPKPFSVPSQNCLGTLAGGASCQITVAFTPTASGPVSGALQITDTASGSPHSVSLSGTGIAPAAVSLSTSSLSFGSQLVGTTSAAQTVTVTNTGGASLSISSIATNQPFAETNNCPASLAGGASCTISVTFAPQASGAANGAVTITDTASGSPQSVSLAGTGAMAAPTLSPVGLSFGNQEVGTSSGNQTVKLTANSPGPLMISSISVSAGFTETNNCPASLSPGASCNITVAFAPSTAGTVTGTLTVVDNGLGSAHTVSLSGTGLDFSVSATPSSVAISSGAHANYTVAVSGLGGSFNHNVSLSCSGLPAQSSCSFSPSGVTPGSGSINSALTIKTAKANGTSGTQPGTYTITIVGNSNPLAHSTTVTLVVN